MQGAVTAECSQLASAISKIEAEVLDGLKHGHFMITIESSIVNRGVRELLVKAGKTHRFRITQDELER